MELDYINVNCGCVLLEFCWWCFGTLYIYILSFGFYDLESGIIYS